MAAGPRIWSRPMWLHNSWYVIAWSRELVDQPLSLRVLGQRLVMYRPAPGEVAVLEDRCPHRQLPLSMGRVEGELLQCGYHGMRLDRHGRCVSVPSQPEARAAPASKPIRPWSGTVGCGFGWVKLRPPTLPWSPISIG